MKPFRIVLGMMAQAALAACFASTATAANTYFAVLSGAFVCNKPPNADPPLCRQGDPDASGSATVMIFGPNHLCAAILVNKIPLTGQPFPAGAHLHIGEASYSGPVVVQLALPSANGGGDPGTSMMCNTAVPAAMIASIRNNPHFFYIDVHGGGYQFGALRGQLF